MATFLEAMTTARKVYLNDENSRVYTDTRLFEVAKECYRRLKVELGISNDQVFREIQSVACTISTITTSSVAVTTTVTTSSAHGLVVGQSVLIQNHSGSTPSINGTHTVLTTPLSTTFTINVNVTVGGTGGSVTPQTLVFSNLTRPIQLEERDANSTNAADLKTVMEMMWEKGREKDSTDDLIYWAWRENCYSYFSPNY